MIGEALRLVRVFYDLKQYEVADRLGISRSHLSELEKGTKSPSMEILEKYSKEFSIPVSEILFFSENIDRARSGEGVRKAFASKVLDLLKFIEMKSA